MISKIVLSLLSVIILFQANQVFADEEPQIITIDFVSGNVIDLDKSPQMIRADIQIQNYNPQDGYYFMKVIRSSDGEIIKNTEILPKPIGGKETDNLFGVQILHYLEPEADEENKIGDYELRIYSEYGSVETVSTFSIIKSSMPETISQNTVEELVTPEEEINEAEELEIDPLVEPESKIPSWVHDIFIWYANETISENELLAALEYLISQGTIKINSN